MLYVMITQYSAYNRNKIIEQVETFMKTYQHNSLYCRSRTNNNRLYRQYNNKTQGVKKTYRKMATKKCVLLTTLKTLTMSVCE